MEEVHQVVLHARSRERAPEVADVKDVSLVTLERRPSLPGRTTPP
jgi:hypothetical protein